MFLFEPFFLEEGADVGGLDNLIEGPEFGLKVTALETDDAVGQGIMLRLGNVLTDDLGEIGQGHHGTAHYEVILFLLFLTAQVDGLTVLEADGLADFLRHADLLTRTVDEFELALGEEDGQGNAWETAARAEVEDACAWTKADDLGNGQGVEYVVLVKLVDVLTRDDVDLRVPVTVEGVELFELLTLRVCQFREITEDEFCCHGLMLE